MGRGGSGGVPYGDELVAFGEAVSRGTDETEATRSALRNAVGENGFVEAASIVGIFNGLVRTADSTGIPLDDGTRKDSSDFRAELGLETYAGSANTDLAANPADAETDDVAKLFR